MLIADKFNSVSIAALSSFISSVKVKIQAVTLVDCGKLRKAENDAFTRSAENLKRQMEQQAKQRKAMIDAIMKQQQQLQKMQQEKQ
jgi:molybdenum cofactor biosynthesis enzyme MoaA